MANPTSEVDVYLQGAKVDVLNAPAGTFERSYPFTVAPAEKGLTVKLVGRGGNAVICGLEVTGGVPPVEPPPVGTTTRQLDFGPKEILPAQGYERIGDVTDVYTAERGWGWVDESPAQIRDRGKGLNPPLDNVCISELWTLRVDLPNGS